MNLWAVACQAPLSMEFSRKENWNGQPFPSPGEVPDHGSNLCLLHCRQILYHLSYQWSSKSYHIIQQSHCWLHFWKFEKFNASKIHHSIIYINHNMEANHEFISRWIYREDKIHTHTHTHTPMEYYSAIKKNIILQFVTTWMDLKGISKLSQSVKHKYYMVSILIGIFKIKQIDEYNKTEADS